MRGPEPHHSHYQSLSMPLVVGQGSLSMLPWDGLHQALLLPTLPGLALARDAVCPHPDLSLGR